MLRSLITAFSTYSRIPMPSIEWDEKNLKYVLWCFPLVGAVQGALLWGLSFLLSKLQVSTILMGVAMCAACILINGGIHMDGFLDTIDALNSFADKKKRLAILKDPHIGAFGAIYAVVYLLMSAAVWSTLGSRIFPEGIFVFVMSRTLSGAGIVSIPTASEEGSAAALVKACDRRNTRTFLTILFIIEAAAFCLITPVSGVICVGIALFVFWHYLYTAVKYFGGVTGDVAGYFLQLCELACLTALAGIGFAVRMSAG